MNLRRITNKISKIEKQTAKEIELVLNTENSKNKIDEIYENNIKKVIYEIRKALSQLNKADTASKINFLNKALINYSFLVIHDIFKFLLKDTEMINLIFDSSQHTLEIVFGMKKTIRYVLDFYSINFGISEKELEESLFTTEENERFLIDCALEITKQKNYSATPANYLQTPTLNFPKFSLFLDPRSISFNLPKKAKYNQKNHCELLTQEITNKALFGIKNDVLFIEILSEKNNVFENDYERQFFMIISLLRLPTFEKITSKKIDNVKAAIDAFNIIERNVGKVLLNKHNATENFSEEILFILETEYNQSIFYY